ncbi:hypothetical protein QJQ45_028830, partial [Haematococcus lacustris]
TNTKILSICCCLALLLFMARKKRRTGVGGPRAVPEDPDFNRDEAAQPDLTEAQRKRKALGKARAARSRDNTFHARKAKLVHLTDHLPQALWDAFLERAVRPRVKAISERGVIGSLLLGFLVRGLFTLHVAVQLDAQGQPLSYTDTDIPVSAADIPDLSCDNLFRQLCRGLPGEGENTRPSAAVAAVLAAHPDLCARLEAIPRYLSDSNMVDHLGQQLQTAFSNILTLLFAGRLKKAVSLAGAKVLLGTNEHQRRFGVRGLVGGHLPAWSKRQCTYVRRMVCGLEVTWLVGEGGVVVTAAMQVEVALQRGLLGLEEGEKEDDDWVEDPANLGRLLRHAVHTTREMEAAMAAWQLDMVPWEQSQPTNLLTRPPRPPTPYALTPTSKCRARHIFIDTRGLYGLMSDAGMLGVLTEAGVTSEDRFYDRDVSAALNIRRCAVGPGPRPTELCYWTNRPAMPKPGEPGQDWVEIPDKPLVLGWPELLFLGIGCILGAGIVVLTGVAARKYAGPAVVLSYLMSAVAALLTSFCYAEFAADLPVVGGAFNYVGARTACPFFDYLNSGGLDVWRVCRLCAACGTECRLALGPLPPCPFPPRVAACDLILEYTLSAAAVAKGFTAYFAQLIGVNLSRLRLQASIFTLDFPALLAVVVASLVLARSTRESSLLNSVVVALHLLLVIFVFAAGKPTTNCILSCCTASNPPACQGWIGALPATVTCKAVDALTPAAVPPLGASWLAGFPHVKEENYHPFMPFGIRGCFTGASVVFFSYVGFDTVATAAEEVKHPGRDLPIGIVGSLSICTVFYVLMCIVISGMQPYTEIDLHAPFSVAFQAVGLDWADKIIAGGAITGIVTSLLGSLLGQARIYVTLGRQHLLPKWLAQVDAASGTPRNATYLTMFTAGILALFLDIEVLSELVSIGALVVFTMVCAGVLFRRYHVRGLGDSARPVGLRLAGIALTSIAFSLSFTERAPLLLPLFFLLAWLAITLSFYRLPVMYTPTLFKCPGSPWVPSLGMLTCLHLIGSLGWPAYVRWIVWFALGTVVYVTYSMHHSQGEGKGAKPPGSEGGSVSAGSSPLLLDRHSHSSDPGNATQLTLSPWLHTGLTQDDGSSASKGRGRDSGGGLGDGNGGVSVNGMGARSGGGLGSGTVELQARPGAAGPGH